MSKYELAVKAVSELSQIERAELVHSMAREMAGPLAGVETNPNVCGGEPCIIRTRIPVWLLERARQLGTGEAELLRAFPSLRAADLVNAWAYVHQHRDEFDLQIRQNEEAA